MKTNWFKRIAAFFRRRFSEEHVVEVVVYVDGRIIENKTGTFQEEYCKPDRLSALAVANGIVSTAYGFERRRLKGRV